MNLNEVLDRDLVERLVELDRENKKTKREMDKIKAELQQRGIQTLENQNVKIARFYAATGNVSVMETQSMDILNIPKLRELLGEGLWETKVKVKTETKYDYDKRLEQMLKAIFRDDYTFEYTLEEFVSEHMSVKPTPDQKRLLLKKLKGDYVSDRKTMLSVFDYAEGASAPDFDVELYYIYKIKNAELIRAFLPEEFLDDTMKKIKDIMIVDGKTSITLSYQDEDK